MVIYIGEYRLRIHITGKKEYVQLFFPIFQYTLEIIFSMRTIFIGDVHGCLLELKDLIEKLSITPQDRVILL